MATEKKSTETGAKAALRAKGFVPVPEAADKLGYSRQGVRLWVSGGSVHGVQLGRGWWVEWSSVVKHFKSIDPEAAKLAGIQ
jgi:hypothetical protein